MPPVLEIRNIRKNYGALRPLRIRDLSVSQGERVALMGLDAGAAEVLVNLVTGATLPDEGEILAFGRPTSAINSSDEWLSWLDRFGIVSDRAVLLDQLTVEQNLAVPLTLDIDPISEQHADAARRLAEEVGLAVTSLATKAGEMPPEVRQRVRLARALALNPAILLFEHPSASLTATSAAAFAVDVVRLAETRNLATLTLTADKPFAERMGRRVLNLQPATGVLQETRGWKAWFAR